ncbi:hypothetical protein [Novosphingobium sp. MMS21-SN21R]|uniref:hypothetical protein n=1 Tax=Novosphingobium sp. MMS21-SN21R TaxID=2969298 RepID=UPI002887EC42|nr:hypothetical protein [Novosphingobium sp. MMS21-SN21R]MDT0509265.1 hypothetical protein [Novosphingobium sp. MMS21-SN21R]
MIRHSAPKTLAALLISASSLALAVPALAQEVVFADNPELAAAALRGERVSQTSGVTQVRLASGAVLSFVEGAEFQLRSDGSVDLFKGNVTVTGTAKGDTVINLAGQGTGRIGGGGSSGSFSVGTDRNGKPVATGRVLTGTASVANGREDKRFMAGQAWEVANGRPRLAMTAPVAPAPRQVRTAATTAPAPAAQTTEPPVASIREGGPAAAAQNGVPVVLGQALAAAGASGDIVSAGQRVQAAVTNPSLETFPSGDLATLVAHASRLERLYGGRPFDQAQADVIRAYLGYLANGGSQAQFLTVYAGLMVQFLDLVRSGAAPSSFSGTSLADINAFVSYRSRTSGFAALESQNRVLVEAYAAFLLGGGNADQFVSRYTSLTSAYFAFLRSGGDPLAFQGASQETLTAYITFLNNSGLLVRLADSDRALLQAYLANGGTAFVEQYRAALSAYFAYLASGKLPGTYTALDPAVLRQYLDTLQATGLFEQVLGQQAEFYAAYLAHLKAGGSIDSWEGLPANVFAGYAQALNAYYAYLADGGLPSGYTALTQAQIRAYLDALQSANAGGAFLGDLATFYGAYFTFLAQGGDPDLYTGLPTPNYQAFADAVSAYLAYLQAGGVPSAYTGADVALLQRYIKALIDSGKLGTLLAGQADFLTAYYAYLANGGSADGYSGLPVYASYVSALEAYYAYLASGGVPSGYTLLTQAQILAYLKALTDAGVLAALFDGTTLAFIQDFYVYLASGGNPDQFAGLPGTGGGGTGGGTGGTRLTTYTGGFPSNAAGTKAIAGHNGNIQPSDGTASIDNTGALTSAGDIGNVGAKVTDVAGDASAVVGRFYDGTAKFKNSQFSFGVNNGLPYVVLAPKGGTLPVSGTVDYKVLAATRPVYADGRTAPGTFDADLTLSFTSNSRVLFFRTLGTIVMPESGGDVTYTFSTPNYANGQLQEVIYDSLGNYFFGTGMTGTGEGCVGGGTGCNISLYGDFAGQEQVNRLGLMYQTYGGSFSAGRIQGAAIFGKDGTFPSGGTGGGTGGSGLLTSYTGGFNGTNPLIHFVTTLKLSSGTQFPGSESGFAATAYTLGGDGGLASYTRPGPFTRTPGTMTTSDIAGDADVLLGRWNNGTNTGANVFTLTANQGFHYIMARAVPTGFAVPTSGIVEYDLLAATKPTWVDGSGAPGTLTASLAIDFGKTVPKIAMEGRVAMPTGGTGGGAYAFDFATTGGLADIARSQTDLLVYPGGQIGFVVQGRDGLSGCSTTDCTVGFNGSFAGSADKFGVTYSVVNGADSAKWIVGAAAFKANGNSVVTPPLPATSAMLTGANTYTFADGGINGATAPEVDIGQDGSVTRIKFNNVSTQIYGAPAILREHGRFGDAAAWSRWDGSTTNANLNPNTHILTGTRAVQLPVSGKVDYELVGSTAPTNFQAADGQAGTVAGSLAVQFGSQVKVGFNLDVQVGTHGWSIGTSGGSADPSNGGATVGTDMRFAAGVLGIARLPGNTSSCQTGCSAAAFGTLYGTGASHVGLGYQIDDVSGGATSTVNGVVVFGRAQP